MTYLGQFTKEQLLSMKETAYHMALAFRGKDEIVRDIMAIALVEVNRELDERKLSEAK